MFFPNFISYTSCNFMHVSVESLVFNRNLILMILYLLYYAIAPIYGFYILSRKINFDRHTGKMKFVLASEPLAIMGVMLYYFISVIINNAYNTWIYTSLIILFSSLLMIILTFTLTKKAEKYFAWVNMIPFCHPL